MKDLVKFFQETSGLDIANSLKVYAEFLKSTEYTYEEKAEVVLIGDHQWRLNDTKQRQDSKYKAIEVLAEAKLWTREYVCFEDVYRDVSSLIRPIPFVGELAIYDTAFRTATITKSFPTDVYLMAGARKGLVNLLGKGNVSSIMSKADIVKHVPELSMLKAYEIEAFLCDYASLFKRGGLKSHDFPKYDPSMSSVCGLRKNMLARKLLFPDSIK